MKLDPIINPLIKLGLTAQQSFIVLLTFIGSFVLVILITLVLIFTRPSTTTTHHESPESKKHHNEPPSHTTHKQTENKGIKEKSTLPIDINAHKTAGIFYFKNSEPEKAIEHLERVAELKGADISMQVMLGNAYIASGHYSKAVTLFEQLILETTIDKHVQDTIATRYGIALFYANKVDESKKILEDCIKKNNENTEAFCFLGQIKAQYTNDSADALNYLEKAVRIDSSYVEGYYQLARYKMEHGDYLKARLFLLKCIELDPLHVKGHSRLGMVYYYLDHIDLALKSYQTALTINPYDYNTHYNLAELYFSDYNDLKKALMECELTLKYNPNHSKANFRAGVICSMQGLYKEAIEYFKKADEFDPNNIRILLQKAATYEKLNLQAEAKETYEQISTIDPLNAIALQKLKYFDLDTNSELNNTESIVDAHNMH